MKRFFLILASVVFVTIAFSKDSFAQDDIDERLTAIEEELTIIRELLEEVLNNISTSEVVNEVAESTEEDLTESEEVSSEESTGLEESLNLDGLIVTVNDVTITDSVGSSFMTSEANDTYIVLNVTVLNDQNESLLFDSSFFKIVYNDRKYDVDTSATMYAGMDDSGMGLMFENINPGSSRTADIVFDVSSDVVEGSGKLLEVQTSLFGGTTGTINID